MELYLFQGNHSFARKKAKAELLAGLVNVSYFTVPVDASTKNPVVDKIRLKLTGLALFTQKETAVLRFLESEKVSRGRKAAWRIPLEEVFLDLITKTPDHITLVIELPAELPKASKFLKLIIKSGGKIQTFKLPPLKDRNALSDEAKEYLSREKVKLDNYSLQKLVDMAKGDWWFVFTALEQAVLYSRSQESLVLNLEELWNLQEDQNIFRLFDAIGQGNKALALRLLYENNAREDLRSGKDVEKTLGFISMMARQLKQLIALKGNITSSEAQKEWQIPVFAYNKVKHQASFFSNDFLAQAYEKLTELQAKAKRGLYSPLSLVDFFILYLISHRQPQ